LISGQEQVIAKIALWNFLSEGSEREEKSQE
jgi:hypothetical protein